ncbi:MAG: hypothetical protein OXU51_25900 [Candidatus Poribacteria bacterium]|nr:hypothetical protein [Candidatus Poribacteria bacterium]
MDTGINMLKQSSEERLLQLNIAHKIFPLPVVEKTLFLLRDWITSIEVTDASPGYFEICIRLVPGAPQDMEDIFYTKLICTAVSLTHDKNHKKIKQYFSQTAAIAMTESQQILKRHLISQAREGDQFPENRATYWQSYKGYRVELGGGFDIFVEEHANTFHLDLDKSIYSVAHVQSVIDKIENSNDFRCIHRAEKSRNIISIIFQRDISQPVIFKTLLDFHKSLRTPPE